MKDRYKQILELILVSVVFWPIAMCFFMWIRYYDLQSEYGIQIVNNIIPTLWELSRIGIYMGLLIGIIYAIFDYLFDNYLFRKLHMGVLLLIKTLAYLFLLIFSVTIVIGFAETLLGMDLPNDRGWWREHKIFGVFVAYFGLFSLIFSFFKISRRRFGKGVLIKLLLGRYARPREENRILMFLDMRSSTPIAEQFGHLTYSALIRDCYLDLNQILLRYKAEIYQYVGDEAVLSWRYKEGHEQDNCIALFFDFQSRLKERAMYYQDRYGVAPEFKAGVHGGTLVVVEVGSVKKELAYHGDVINTAARIQEQCNIYGEDLLVSETLMETLSLSPKYSSKRIGELKLKGKRQNQVLYAVDKAQKNP